MSEIEQKLTLCLQKNVELLKLMSECVEADTPDFPQLDLVDSLLHLADALLLTFQRLKQERIIRREEPDKRIDRTFQESGSR